MKTRTKAERDDDRATIIAALENAGGPLRIDELLRDAWGITQDHVGEQRMRLDLKALVRARVLVEEWPSRTSVFLTYRLATPDDLDAEADREDLARMMSRWEPEDGGWNTAQYESITTLEETR